MTKNDYNSELEVLELGDNRVKVIENLANLSRLKQLFLGKNKIRRIEGLQALKDLQILSLPV